MITSNRVSCVSLTFAILMLSMSASVCAHSPVDFLETFSVAPSIPVDHAVDLKSQLDESRREMSLSGPEFFSRSVGAMNRPAKEIPAFLNWYRIKNGQAVQNRRIKVLDMIRVSGDKQLTVGAAEYFLSPAQRIATGSPSPVPGGLDHYLVYRIVDAPQIQRDIKIDVDGDSSDRKLGKPVFLCVAAKEWHHHDFFDTTHPKDGFVIYELDSKSHQSSITTIDQFGLNELTSDQSRWLCVRAAILR